MDYYYSIASGSKGNCAFVNLDNANILIDMGVSVRALSKALISIEKSIDSIDAVLITHEHIDHIKGMQTFFKKYDIPVFASTRTAENIYKKVPNACGKITEFVAGYDFPVCDIMVKSVRTPHDTIESVGYVLQKQEYKLGFFTDIGFIPSNVKDEAIGCDAIVLESNHDTYMLETGPYPYPLKKRISGERGHLSNRDCAEFARELVQNGTKTLILAHLSEKNNVPELAFSETDEILKSTGREYRLFVAPVHQMEYPVSLKEEKLCLI